MFGDSVHCRPRSGFELGQAGDDLVAYLVAKVTDQDGNPAPGIMLNTIDEDRVTPTDADVTDKNGMAILKANIHPDKDRVNYVRIMILPIGYGDPTPRAGKVDVPFYGIKKKISANVFSALSNYRHTNEGAQHLDALSKLTPDFSFTVKKTGTPGLRVAADRKDYPAMTWDANPLGTVANGVAAFRVFEKDGTVARPDRDTPYIYELSSVTGKRQGKEVTTDLDGDGRIWLGMTVAGPWLANIVPVFGGRPHIFGQGIPNPEYGFTRLLKFIAPWPYVYDIKHTEKDGGLLPAGAIEPQELVGTTRTPEVPTPPPPPPSPTPPEGPGRVVKSSDASKVVGDFPWLTLLLVGSLAAVAYLYLPTVLEGRREPSFAGLGRRSRRRKKR